MACKAISIDNITAWLYISGIRQRALAPRAVRPTPVRRVDSDPREPAAAIGLRPSAVLETTMSKSKGELVSVKIIPNEQGNPQGKLADAEVVFEAEAGPLSGMKLIGFAVWERRDGGRNVTFPARQYSVNGERRSFALLRPSNGNSVHRRRSGSASSTRTAASRLTPDRSTSPRRCGLSPAAWGRRCFTMGFRS